MKEKKLYTCEMCYTDYNNEEDCKQCEKSHKVPVIKPAGMRWRPKCEFPATIDVEADGKVRRYKLLRNAYLE